MSFDIGDFLPIAANDNSAGTVLGKYVHSTRDDDPQVWLEGSGNSDIRYVYANYQGSVVATTNAAGSIVQLYKYDPYGTPKDASNNDSWQGFRFRYTGQQIIPEAKLYYYKARVYDPNLGTFLQTDPIGTKDDLNLYAYVKDDPINHIDPDGLYTCSAGKAQCAQLKAALVTIRAVISKLDPKSASFARLNAVSNAYGKEGEKNGVNVVNMKLPEGSTGKTTNANGKITVALDFEKLNKTSYSKMEGGAYAFEGSVVHEGKHAWQYQVNAIGTKMEKEQAAYAAEDNFYRAIGQWGKGITNLMERQFINEGATRSSSH